jgi:hypothetical protein
MLVINGFNLSVPVPDLPSVKVLRRQNTGFSFRFLVLIYINILFALLSIGQDFGAHAAGLREAHRLVESSKIKYYGFLNCGVTGPFLPSYLPSNFDWFSAFTVFRLQQHFFPTIQ